MSPMPAQFPIFVDIIYLVEVAKSTDIIGLISKELAVSNSLIAPTKRQISVLKFPPIFDCNHNLEGRIRAYGFAPFIVPKSAFLSLRFGTILKKSITSN